MTSSYELTQQELDKKMNLFDGRLRQHKNPLVIYHANCADGFSAAWCFYNIQDAQETNYDFHPGVYNEAPPDCTDRIVYLVDFSYKRDVVKAMCVQAKEVILIDHHKTAIDDLKDMEEVNFGMYADIERSGAMLAWDYLHNTIQNHWNIVDHTHKPGDAMYVEPPLLLNHIQDRDLWKFKLAGTREISADVFSWEYTFENWDRLMKANQAELLKMTAAGAAIERKHHKDIAELVKVTERRMKFMVEMDPVEGPAYDEVPVASLPYTLTSDAGHLMAKNFEDGTKFAACYWDTATHRIFSLRSCDNGADVSDVAKLYGGGGHKNAAGFRVPRDHVLARS